MSKSKINWTRLARFAPLNPQTGKFYKGQSIKRVLAGERQNEMLKKWLQEQGFRCAKTKEGKYRSGRRVKSRHEEKPVISKQLAEINKAIEGSLSS